LDILTNKYPPADLVKLAIFNTPLISLKVILRSTGLSHDEVSVSTPLFILTHYYTIDELVQEYRHLRSQIPN
jgi:hypothetical protein